MEQRSQTFRHRTMGRMALLGALLMTPALPAAAQQHERDEWVARHIHNDRRLEITVRGRFELTPDERAIATLSPGGRIQIEEATSRTSSRMVIVTADNAGTLSHLYVLNGRQQPWDAAAEAWLAELLPRAAREFGMGAESRVRRIHQRGGASAVLGEIEQIESSSSRRAHLQALFALGPVPPRELPRTLRAVERVSSTSSRAGLLRQLATHLDLRDAQQRAGFFGVVRTIASSSERRSLLMDVLARPDAAHEAVLVEILDVAAAIPSSSERAALLIAVADRHALGAERVRTAFFATLDGIPSSSERRRVLTAVLRRHGEQSAVTRGVIVSAAAIPSDSEKAAVLMEVPVAQLEHAETAQLYRRSMETIRSNSARERVMRRLVGAAG